MPKNAPGNKTLRQIVFNHVAEYSNTRCLRERAVIVRSIVEQIRDLCRPFGGGAFVKYEQGKWWEVNHTAAREKVTSIFRDFLHDQYKSSTKNKVAKRRAKNEIIRHQEMMQLASLPVISANKTNPTILTHQPKQQQEDTTIEFGTVSFDIASHNDLSLASGATTMNQSTAPEGLFDVFSPSMFQVDESSSHQEERSVQEDDIISLTPITSSTTISPATKTTASHDDDEEFHFGTPMMDMMMDDSVCLDSDENIHSSSLLFDDIIDGKLEQQECCGQKERQDSILWFDLTDVAFADDDLYLSPADPAVFELHL